MNQNIDIGNVFTRVLETYRDQFTLLIPAALLLFIPVAVINGLLVSSGGVLLALLAAAVGLIATYWFQGMVVEAVRDIMDGRRDQTVASLFGSASPVIAPLIGAGILAGIGIAIGLILLIVPGLFLLTIWAVIAPVIVIERTGVFGSFGRSQQLVKGNGWQVFGVILIIFLGTLIVSAILQGIFSAISDSFVGYAIGDAITRVLIGPIAALAAAVLYFELKRAHGEQVPGAGEPAGVGAADTAQQPAAPDTARQPAAPSQPGAPGSGPEAPGGPQQPGGPQPGGAPPGGPQSPGPESPERPPGA